MSWILHRVDDRLIHGQVVIAYGERLHPKRIWVVDDAAAIMNAIGGAQTMEPLALAASDLAALRKLCRR